MMKKFYTFLIALFFSGIVFAQWQELPSFTNAILKQIQFVDENTGWIRGDHPGPYSVLFKTIDGGQTWDSASFSHLIGEFCFINEDIGFTYRADTLLKTIDGGDSWTYYPIPIPPSSGLNFTHPDTGWIARYDANGGPAFYKTVDGGLNWIDLTNELSGYADGIQLINGEIGYVACSAEPTPYNFQYTNDGGLTWSINQIDFRSNEFQMIEEGIGYASELDKIFHFSSFHKTIDNGISWTEIPSPDANYEFFQSLCFVTKDIGWISISESYWGGAGSIFYTKDGGQIWAEQLDKCIVDFSFVNQNTGWAITYDSIVYHTNNGGISGMIDIEKEKHSLLIYPNPSLSTITIELPPQPLKNTSLTLSNTNGQQLITQPITKPQTEINIGHLPTGIYIVKVWNDREAMVQKVIKQ